MELLKVTLEYKDLATVPLGVDRNVYIYPRKTAETYVAVHGRYGVEMIREAGTIAMRDVIGEAYMEWEPIVTSVVMIGVVHVEKDDSDS